MYLKTISLTNFRQFSVKEDETPGITVQFSPKFNVIVGENDSGKTAIIDAIRYLLGSISNDFEKIKQEDFFCYAKDKYTDNFYIEGTFTSLSDKEAGLFLEWLSFDENGDYELRVSLKVERKRNDNGQEYIDQRIQAGEKNFEFRLSSKARDLLKTTYLKPLRDADTELKPGIRSRLAQILKVHPAFKKESSETNHSLEQIMQEANDKVEGFFKEDYVEDHSLVSDIESLLSDFYDNKDQNKAKTNFSVSSTDLSSILRKLSINTEDVNLGLGNMNLLFIATELLLLNDYVESSELVGPHITLIEEIEAHLHTQAQIRLIKYLEEELESNSQRAGQFILTSHSTNLVSSIDPKNIIFIQGNVAYPMRREFSELEDNDFEFLERFLDATKSNLFFAKGVIFVEGDSEMLLIPALANFIGYPLHKYGISLVNVRGTSFERYIKLFSRSTLWKESMKLPSITTPIAIITDIDVKPWVYYEQEEKNKAIYSILNEEELDELLTICNISREKIIEENIGNEYSTLKKLANDFKFEISSQNTDYLEKIAKKEITPEYINACSRDKFRQIEDKYEKYDANLKLCIAPQWTLEYCLALSSLAPILLEAVQEIRYKKPYEGKQYEVFQSLMSEFDKGTLETEKIAYEIFKPINNKLVSKAEVAQTLAVKLNNLTKEEVKHMEWKEKINCDENLKYLINAIKHTSSIIGSESNEDE
ncbi:AAA family ATPase [Psychrobacillus sp.]|uniref:ATP-dependent nuclease n=1 Tax=Psychrobacillus sp. TaxID=1871623 RepID=UPI0028BE047F|nr:AAA family ATPase [Psychrobacillus sp.]